MTITISGVILAGGQALRMQGKDKGLVMFQGKPMISYCLERLSSQVATLSINANRNQDRYAEYGFPVFADELANFQGPLSGMLTALKRTTTDYVLFVPCDNPFLSAHLCQRLFNALIQQQAKLAYAHNGERPQPTFCLMSRVLIPALEDYLNRGERRILKFLQEQEGVVVDFSDEPHAFQNFNTFEDLQNNSGIKIED